MPRLSASHRPVFLLNSCLDLSSAPRASKPEDPFSRSYGVSLPSSLTVSLSSALVYSTRPPVSVYGTGPSRLNRRLRLFSGVCSSVAVARPEGLAYFPASPRDVSSVPQRLLPFNALFGQRAHDSLLRPRGGSACRGSGILTACPSARPERPALGPDLPRAD